MKDWNCSRSLFNSEMASKTMILKTYLPRKSHYIPKSPASVLRPSALPAQRPFSPAMGLNFPKPQFSQFYKRAKLTAMTSTTIRSCYEAKICVFLKHCTTEL